MLLPASARRRLVELGFRLGGWPRRLAVLACLVLAGLSALTARRAPTAAPLVAVVVASRDVAAGAPLGSADVTLSHWTPATVPPAAAHDPSAVVGQIASGPLTRGEPITPSRLKGAGLTVGLPAGSVAVSVILDKSALTLVRAGDLIDLLVVADISAIGAAAQNAPARVVAKGVRVLMVAPSTTAASAQGDAWLVVAADPPTAQLIAGASSGRIVATLRAPP